MPDSLSTALVDLKHDEVIAAVTTRLRQGEDALQLMAACRQGMTMVGERFQQGDYFLSELLLAAEIFKEAAALLEPALIKGRAPVPAGTVVLATLRGDIHDLGKNIVAALLRAHGFHVYDLGVDVAPERVVDMVCARRPDFVGFSALLTTAFDSMKEAAVLLARAGIRDQVKLMVGGGVTTPAVKAYVGADFQATDASAGLRYCLAVQQERRRGTSLALDILATRQE